MSQDIQLQPDMANKAAFVNSLFASGARDAGTAIASGAITTSFADPDSRGLILGAWLGAWRLQAGAGDDSKPLAPCPRQDSALLGFLVEYIQRSQAILAVPTLTLDHCTGEVAVYRNGGYQPYPFQSGGDWQFGEFSPQGEVLGGRAGSTVACFLELLYYGAHIVVVCSDQDRKGGTVLPDLRTALIDGLPHRLDISSSHYGHAATLSGVYYAPDGAPVPSVLHSDVESLATSTPPGDEPLIVSLLTGVTAKTHCNNFVQLEGWPSQPLGNKRHDADYGANKTTFWNFSTFGACAYSEKRSTPVFLCSPTFELTCHPDTGMPYYWGANPNNATEPSTWMHPDLVIVDSLVSSADDGVRPR